MPFTEGTLTVPAETVKMFCGYPTLDMDLKDALRHLNDSGTVQRIFYDEHTGLGMVIRESRFTGWSSEQFKTSGRFLTFCKKVVVLPKQIHTVE